jgi:hypothetical protein
LILYINKHVFQLILYLLIISIVEYNTLILVCFVIIYNKWKQIKAICRSASSGQCSCSQYCCVRWLLSIATAKPRSMYLPIPHSKIRNRAKLSSKLWRVSKMKLTWYWRQTINTQTNLWVNMRSTIRICMLGKSIRKIIIEAN